LFEEDEENKNAAPIYMTTASGITLKEKYREEDTNFRI
jgi:hypothetical protein